MKPLPSSIELSEVQREILNLIIADQKGVDGPVEPERVILHWSDALPVSNSAHKLCMEESEVTLLRHRWLEGTPRIAAAERKFQRAFRDLVSLIFRVPNEECAPRTVPDQPPAEAEHQTGSPAKPPGSNQLRPATRALIEILHHKPNAYGINRSNWNQASLAEVFGQLYGQRPSKSTVSRLLRQAGLSWKKSKKVLTSPDPLYREKVELLLKTLHSLKADEDLFFVDELGPLPVKRYGGRCFTPKHVIPTHPQNQRSKGSITLYGALSATTNQVSWFYDKTKDSAGMIDMAEILYNQHHNKSRIYLTWDAASWHRSAELVEWADHLNQYSRDNGAGPIIEFVPLPSSAQFLDVIEAVFSAMKRAVIHGSDYASEAEMKTAISAHFRNRNEFFSLNPKRAGKKIWDVDFFQDYDHIRSGNYREW
jgi:transposase